MLEPSRRHGHDRLLLQAKSADLPADLRVADDRLAVRSRRCSVALSDAPGRLQVGEPTLTLQAKAHGAVAVGFFC